MILRIVGATPQLLQSFTPIRELFCTYTNVVVTQDPLSQIQKQKNLKSLKRINFSLHFTSLHFRKHGGRRSIAGIKESCCALFYTNVVVTQELTSNISLNKKK